jgi:hypothetical protein
MLPRALCGHLIVSARKYTSVFSEEKRTQHAVNVYLLITGSILI